MTTADDIISATGTVYIKHFLVQGMDDAANI